MNSEIYTHKQYRAVRGLAYAINDFNRWQEKNRRCAIHRVVLKASLNADDKCWILTRIGVNGFDIMYALPTTRSAMDSFISQERS